MQLIHVNAEVVMICWIILQMCHDTTFTDRCLGRVCAPVDDQRIGFHPVRTTLLRLPYRCQRSSHSTFIYPPAKDFRVRLRGRFACTGGPNGMLKQAKSRNHV